MLGDCNDILDDDGRPLGEIRASEAVRKNVETRYTMCPYLGSRHRSVRLMNASALDQLASVWPQPLGVLDAVRRLHGVAPNTAPPLIELCRIAFTALCLPAYLTYQSTPRPVPVHVAATHKMTQGLFGLCKNLLIERVSQGEDYRNVTAGVGDLYRFAEQRDALLSRTGIEACAAPPAMIGEALNTLVVGRSHEGDASPPWPMPAAATDTHLLEYSAAVANMIIWTTVTAITLHSAMEHLQAALTADPEEGGSSLKNSRNPIAHYNVSGFNDVVVAPILNMPEDIRNQYALGASALCTDEKSGSQMRELVRQSIPYAHFVYSPFNQCAPDFWANRALETENEALVIFNHLQKRVLAALDRPEIPFESSASTVSDAFGKLPSQSLWRTAPADR